MKIKTEVESKNFTSGRGATFTEEGSMCHGAPRNLGRLRKAKQVKTRKREDWSLS